MKKYIILLLLFIGTTVSLSADNSDRDKDSILACINAIENDSIRLDYEVSQQQKYIRSPFARILVDKLYHDARKLNNRKKEMIALCGYFNIANATLNVEEIEKELKRIEEHAYKYDLYDYFFRCKRGYLSIMASNGNMEWAINEARKMKKEAIRLKQPIGIISAQISLAQAYKFARNDLKVIETLEEILRLDGVEDKEKLSIYLDLYTAYNNLKQYKKGLTYLDLQYNLLQKMTKEDAKSHLSSRLMHTNIIYADTYMALNDYDKAKEHLKQAEKYYTPTCFITYFALYHSTHASYYAHLKKWKLCFAEIDLAINRLEQEQPLLKQSMIILKISYLEQAGKLSEAVAMHRELLATTDSLNQAFIQKQEEALAQNYKWECGMIKHAQNTYLLSLISIIFIILLSVVICYFIIKLYWAHIQVQKAKNEAEKAKQIAIKSKHLKEVLLKNISKEIEAPFNKIKKASEQTASTSSIPTKTLILDIEKEAINLIQLLDLVVKLSKLEAGEIKFDASQVNILSVCHEAIQLVNERPDNKVEIYFTSQVEFQPILVDREWLSACLSTAMTTPYDYKLTYKLYFNVKYSDKGQMVTIEMIGSPLSNISFNNQIQDLKNQINNLFIKKFNGIYEIKSSKLRPILTISLPYKEEQI